MSSLPGLGFGVGLVAGSCYSLFFFSLGLIVSRVILFIYDVRVREIVSMFNEPLILSLCGVVRERLLTCRAVVG